MRDIIIFTANFRLNVNKYSLKYEHEEKPKPQHLKII